MSHIIDGVEPIKCLEGPIWSIAQELDDCTIKRLFKVSGHLEESLFGRFIQVNFVKRKIRKVIY